LTCAFLAGQRGTGCCRCSCAFFKAGSAACERPLTSLCCYASCPSPRQAAPACSRSRRAPWPSPSRHSPVLATRTLPPSRLPLLTRARARTRTTAHAHAHAHRSGGGEGHAEADRSGHTRLDQR
jgi:hypothetical protein